MLLINACSSLPEVDRNLQLHQWANHQALVNKLESWNIRGRTAIQSAPRFSYIGTNSTQIMNYDLFLV